MKRNRTPGSLSALVNQARDTGGHTYLELDTDRVAPRDQTREDFGDIAALAFSIKHHKQAQPIVVRKAVPEDSVDADFIILAGERRWRACIEAGVPVLAILSDTDKPLVLELIENFQRKNLTPFESAKGIQSLLQEGYKKGEVAEILGVSNQYITIHSKLLKAPPAIREVSQKGLTTDSETLALLTDLWAIDPVCAQRIIDEGEGQGLSRKDVRAQLKALKAGTAKSESGEEVAAPSPPAPPEETAKPPKAPKEKGKAACKKSGVAVRVAFSLADTPDESQMGTLCIEVSPSEGMVYVLGSNEDRHEVPAENVQVIGIY